MRRQALFLIALLPLVAAGCDSDDRPEKVSLSLNQAPKVGSANAVFEVKVPVTYRPGKRDGNYHFVLLRYPAGSNCERRATSTLGLTPEPEQKRLVMSYTPTRTGHPEGPGSKSESEHQGPWCPGLFQGFVEWRIPDSIPARLRKPREERYGKLIGRFSFRVR
jgi:hypothetical protein